MSNVTPLTDAEFAAKVEQSDKPVLVDFWAEWCSPCKQMMPVIDEIAGKYGDRVDFYKVDADNNPDAPTRYMVQGLPTLLIFKNGEVVQQLTGGKTKAQLVAAVESVL
ncbi:thymidylate synthase [Platysternon megacephalum]|uniref:Thioredoxin n=1 Tax=Platysternon megacephalum TaxID=55544 RepID=A0A4D9DC46_9SAUR|nr:thymidylate synthase [Platysternon megacephalum]